MVPPNAGNGPPIGAIQLTSLRSAKVQTVGPLALAADSGRQIPRPLAWARQTNRPLARAWLRRPNGPAIYLAQAAGLGLLGRLRSGQNREQRGG